MRTGRVHALVVGVVASALVTACGGGAGGLALPQGVPSLSHGCTPPVLDALPGQLDGPLKWRFSSQVSETFPPGPPGYGGLAWNHSIPLENTGTKPLVLDKLYVAGVPGTPAPVIKLASVGPDGLPQPYAVVKAVDGMQPPVKPFAGYRLAPAPNPKNYVAGAPYLVLGIHLPACASTGHHRYPFTYAYNQNYVVFYHVLGGPSEYLAPFAFRDGFCGDDAPTWCWKSDIEDWPPP